MTIHLNDITKIGKRIYAEAGWDIDKMKSLDFGINIKDYKPNQPCEDCGLIDASVKPHEVSGRYLCSDHNEIESDKICKEILDEMKEGLI